MKAREDRDSRHVQSLNHVQLFANTWTAAPQVSRSFTISWTLLKLMFIVLVILSNHLILFSSCPQSFPASGSFPMSRLFTSGGQSIGASASASVLLYIEYWIVLEYSGLVTFRIDWFDLHAVQGTLKSLLQHHRSRASILWQERWLFLKSILKYIGQPQ